MSNFFNSPTPLPISRLNQQPEIMTNLEKGGRAQNLHYLI
jgi:hypothetical protein